VVFIIIVIIASFIECNRSTFFILVINEHEDSLISCVLFALYKLIIIISQWHASYGGNCVKLTTVIGLHYRSRTCNAFHPLSHISRAVHCSLTDITYKMSYTAASTLYRSIQKSRVSWFRFCDEKRLSNKVTLIIN